MDYRQMGERIYIRIDKGEEILAQVEDVCRKLHISAATFQGIGACGEVEVATYIYPGQAGIPASCAEWYAGDDFPHGKYRDRKAGGIGAARPCSLFCL